MKLDRSIYILLALEREKKITAKRLAEELMTSVRTIYRDIEALCAAGIPIYTEPGQNGGISLMEGYHTQIKHFDKEDIIYLYLNGMGVKAEKSSILEKHTDISLQKIVRALPETQAEELQEIVNRFVVDNSPWWGETQPMPSIDLLLQAVFQLHKLRISYRKANKETSERVLRPYGIVIKEMTWYLVGYCEQSLAVRMLRCDRIIECKCLSDSFVYPKDFDLREYYREALSNFKEKCSIEEQFPVTMTINEAAFCHLKGLDYKVLSHEKNQYRICVNLYGEREAENDYWNLFLNATEIEPKKVRDSIYRKLADKLNNWRQE